MKALEGIDAINQHTKASLNESAIKAGVEVARKVLDDKERFYPLPSNHKATEGRIMGKLIKLYKKQHKLFEKYLSTIESKTKK